MLQQFLSGRRFLVLLGVVALSAWAHGELARETLDGTWDFAFAPGETLAAAKVDFVATDKITVPGCFDMMPKWYAQRGLAHYRRTFTLANPVRNAFLKVKGFGLRAKFFVDGRAVGESDLAYSTIELELGALAAGAHTLVAALDNTLDGNIERVFKPNYDFYLAGGFFHGVDLKMQYEPVELDRVVVRTRDYRTGTVELTLEAKGELPADLVADVSFDGGAPVAVSFTNARATAGAECDPLESCASQSSPRHDSSVRPARARLLVRPLWHPSDRGPR